MGDELAAAFLEHGTVWVWRSEDDYNFKHAAYFPPSVALRVRRMGDDAVGPCL